MSRAQRADLLLINGRVVTLDPRQPRAEAVAISGERIHAVGSTDALAPLRGPDTEVVDAGGGVVIPAFHDAHMHLLSYARFRSRVDCRGLSTIEAIKAAIAERARAERPGTWVRAVGFDDAILEDRRQPHRQDLDAAAPHHLVRLQHRTLHLDVLNTRALRELGLLDSTAREVERDPKTGEPTGRLYHAAELLRSRMPRVASHRLKDRFDGLGADVRAASLELLRLGITTVQDATFTNGPAEWELFRRLLTSGDLQVRLVMLQGRRARQELCQEASIDAIPGLLLGPVKIMLEETRSDVADARAAVEEARQAGLAVALHAVSEAEVAIAVAALLAASPKSTPLDVPSSARGPDRVEHGGVIPDALLPDLRAAGAMVVGQPALVHERGDLYMEEYPPQARGWLHRARSLIAAGVDYAVGSDAPVCMPAPALSLYAARRRRTPRGQLLGPQEALGPTAAVAAHTLGPARAIGLQRELGRIRPGACADIVVLDPEVVEAQAIPTAQAWARLTIMNGRVVWRRP